MRTLIKHGADLNKPLSAGKDKITPLMIAAQRGDLTLARVLVQSGASVELLGLLQLLLCNLKTAGISQNALDIYFFKAMS